MDLSGINSVSASRVCKAVTPSDSTDLSTFRMLYVGGAGAVAVVLTNGATVTFAAVPAGTILPIIGAKVKATGTTATSIVAMY